MSREEGQHAHQRARIDQDDSGGQWNRFRVVTSTFAGPRIAGQRGDLVHYGIMKIIKFIVAHY